MINNKLIAIILAVLTFILGSILFTIIIFYIFGYPLSSIADHQLYVFFGVLVSIVLATLVYGRGSKEHASNVTRVLNESLDLDVEEETVRKLLSNFKRFPPFLVNVYVSKDMNAVKEFESQIDEYKSQLSDEDLLKIGKVIEMPIPELQNLLDKLYLETNLEQFKILADSKAESFLALNIKELKRVLF